MSTILGTDLLYRATSFIDAPLAADRGV